MNLNEKMGGGGHCQYNKAILMEVCNSYGLWTDDITNIHLSKWNVKHYISPDNMLWKEPLLNSMQKPWIMSGMRSAD